MNRSTRRRVTSQIREIMKKNGDNCSICDKAFPHNSKTFGGVTANGTSALVGECCAGKLSETLISGVFVNRNYEELLKIKGNSPNPEVSPEKLSDVITPLQDYFSGVDKLGADIMKSAGVQSKNASVNFSDSSWKRDDADWFKDNPERSHRLRPFFKEEAADLPVAFLKNKPPPNHEFQVLIRQVNFKGSEPFNFTGPTSPCLPNLFT